MAGSKGRHKQSWFLVLERSRFLQQLELYGQSDAGNALLVSHPSVCLFSWRVFIMIIIDGRDLPLNFFFLPSCYLSTRKCLFFIVFLMGIAYSSEPGEKQIWFFQLSSNCSKRIFTERTFRDCIKAMKYWIFLPISFSSQYKTWLKK